MKPNAHKCRRFRWNIILIPVDENESQLALAGAYRPPFAAVGQGLDRVLLHRAASATVRSLLRHMAEKITAATPVVTRPEPDVPGSGAVVAPRRDRRPGGNPRPERR